ncbi:MAG TPA: 3-hydroxybutyryl-CoA dehydrogenase [Gemmatimonadetes bacterium]|nr:3-hydroxybutyryl-CoA dehydrogenase [Gemmatimonadota bacterium]HBD99926.1 3-hydroxybutyryl-CoA dehydrogenase [Gemmatimonadota bacterium]HIC54752.1 3-hydroxybutyryl-CoA dehydrogenase [Gemmatimonadota bacterium]HIN50152.1 3-hydroxybutyryl-CoA dehydrogenase [Gemmatimonadota bacterium]
MKLDISKVGVVGCGLMGGGIAEVAAKSGFDVTVREVTDEFLEKGEARIRKSMERAVQKEKLTAEDRDAALQRLSFTTDVSDLQDCDIVIEAIVEELEAKNALFGELDGLCGSGTIFASNTSSLTITDLAAATSRADRFVGMHFFNPVPVMKLVEVVRTIATSDETFDRAFAFSRALGKAPVAAKDNSGFIVNLLLVPYMLDAIRQLERGVAGVEDIDTAMALGCGYPMGPFILCDFVGLDTLNMIGEIMYEEYREARYAPPPLLKRIVAMGRFGRKTGMGFYDWSGDKPTALPL